jgi:Zn-dependent membrane protease YugP
MIFFMLLSWWAGSRLKSKFAEYQAVPTSSGLSGAQIAEKMLRDNNIYDVSITCVDGQLTDHYNPQNKSINLSTDVYHGRNVAAAAVAAHETGHAVQHATAYSFLQFRSAMVPVVSFSSKLMNVIFIASIFFSAALKMFSMHDVLLIIVIAQGAITLFSVITLPVEFDASARALQWLNAAKITHGEEYIKAKTALNWAASTYVIAALAAITSLLYYLAMFLGRRD